MSLFDYNVLPDILKPGMLQNTIRSAPARVAPTNLAPRPMSVMPMQPSGGNIFQRILGGIGGAIAGPDDGRLDMQSNLQARRSAMLQAGLALMASRPGQSTLGNIGNALQSGMQAGGEVREQAYMRTAEERLAQALNNPAITAKLTPDQLAMIQLMPPMEAAKLLAQLAFSPKATPEAKVVGEGGALVGPDGKLIFENKKEEKLDLPSDLKAALWENGLDPDTMTSDQKRGVMARYEALKKAGSTTVNINPAKEGFGQQNTLADSFRRDVAEHQTIANSWGAISEAAKDPSPAGDLALIFSYMKLLDPTSAVRETEFANAQNAAGVPERIRAQFNRIRNGERLTQQTRADFVAQARSQAMKRQKQLKPVMDRYKRRAAGVGMDPSLVIFDPYEEAGLGPDVLDDF
jgi:hypothetical protein